MKTSWLIGLIMLFVVCSLVSGILEMQYLSAATDQESVIENLFSGVSLSGLNPFTGAWEVMKFAWEKIEALWAIFVFDYAFFTGTYQIVRWAIFLPISAAVIVSLVMVLRGVGST